MMDNGGRSSTMMVESRTVLSKKEDEKLNSGRRIAAAVLTAALSMGAIGLSAGPAEATKDTTWPTATKPAAADTTWPTFADTTWPT